MKKKNTGEKENETWNRIWNNFSQWFLLQSKIVLASILWIKLKCDRVTEDSFVYCIWCLVWLIGNSTTCLPILSEFVDCLTRSGWACFGKKTITTFIRIDQLWIYVRIYLKLKLEK